MKKVLLSLGILALFIGLIATSCNLLEGKKEKKPNDSTMKLLDDGGRIVPHDTIDDKPKGDSL